MDRTTLIRPAVTVLTRGWPPFTRLFLVGDGLGWSIDEDVRHLKVLARRLRIRLAERRLLAMVEAQSVFYANQFDLLRRDLHATTHRVGTAYFHGRPGTPGMPEFDECYDALRRQHERIARVQVSHREMEDVVLSTGIAPEKVCRIPIGVDLSLFQFRDEAARVRSRERLGIPQSAFVVGSFQKDGVGFGDGCEPKWIKGPDVLVAALVATRARVPELFVLLSGPARGYVRSALERLRIPYRNIVSSRYEEIPLLYRALDAVLIASRQEGGPKALLEGMAIGVPVVTTRVGQAADLVVHGHSALMVDVEDAEGLAMQLTAVADGSLDGAALAAAGRATAEAHGYDRQLPLWHEFFDGFVAHG